MIATMPPAAPHAGALLFTASLQSAFVPFRDRGKRPFLSRDHHRRPFLSRSTTVATSMGGDELSWGDPWVHALLFLMAVPSAFVPVPDRSSKPAVLPRPVLFAAQLGDDDWSMGDIWERIEWLRRRIDENKLEMLDVIERQKRAESGRVGDGSYESLEGKFNELVKQGDKLTEELVRLIAIAVRQRLRGGVR